MFAAAIAMTVTRSNEGRVDFKTHSTAQATSSDRRRHDKLWNKRGQIPSGWFVLNDGSGIPGWDNGCRFNHEDDGTFGRARAVNGSFRYNESLLRSEVD